MRIQGELGHYLLFGKAINREYRLREEQQKATKLRSEVFMPARTETIPKLTGLAKLIFAACGGVAVALASLVAAITLPWGIYLLAHS